MSSILIVTSKKEGNSYEVANYLKANQDADLYIMDGGSSPDIKQYNYVVLCSGVYAGKIHAQLATWLSSLEKKDVSDSVKFHLFLTWFGRSNSDAQAMESVAKILEDKGIAFNRNYGSCFGGKAFIRKGHPDGTDFKDALEWMHKETGI